MECSSRIRFPSVSTKCCIWFYCSHFDGGNAGFFSCDLMGFRLCVSNLQSCFSFNLLLDECLHFSVLSSNAPKFVIVIVIYLFLSFFFEGLTYFTSFSLYQNEVTISNTLIILYKFIRNLCLYCLFQFWVEDFSLFKKFMYLLHFDHILPHFFPHVLIFWHNFNFIWIEFYTFLSCLASFDSAYSPEENNVL